MTKTNLKRIAEQAESHCEFDQRGGPPVVVVNWAGASIIYSTFKKPNFWVGGVALGILGGGELFANLIVLRERYGKGLAYTNLEKLAQDVLKALTNDGIAIVCSCSSIPLAEIERMKCEERGHVIQNGVEKKAKATPRGFGWYEDLYDRPEARSFVEGLKRSFNTLYDTDCRVSIVDEFAMKISSGQWRRYDIAADSARAWITVYFREIQHELGLETLLQFRPVLRGRVAKAAFGDAVVGARTAHFSSAPPECYSTRERG